MPLIGKRHFKKSFPRCFTLAVKKQGVVQDFGDWVESKWVWKIDTRRPLFDWELVQWRCLLTTLECFSIQRNLSDSVAWAMNLNGVFSVGSFIRELEVGTNSFSVVPNFIWKGLCPPKIEIFVWQLWKGKVLVKYVLHRREMSQLLSLDAHFVVWKRRQLITYFSIAVKDWLKGWNGFCPAPNQERVWCSMVIVTVWTIWESRNQVVYELVDQDVHQAADMVKYRTVWWFKHLGNGSTESVDSLLRNMRDLCVDIKKLKMSKIMDWIPPYDDNLKFNVDGSSKRKPGPSGICGVLRDSYGKVLCIFSAHTGIMLSCWPLKELLSCVFPIRSLEVAL
ncbi:hypothetical protein Ddye_022484 [Dipteronia dyeriana]|uniref:Reverse transcriptase zinc-binding domain-containing protein n=1 Tax=Dipteronia dyeriana TaxID=168575 RepID=A0AAD9TRB3_9ROSI|nr:hypothetical protein Ddye_022484 [Dipteronia dyeriana]